MVESDYLRYSVVSFGLCPYKMYELEQAEEGGFALKEDGSLIMFSNKKLVYLKDYCLDSFIGDNITSVYHCFPPPMVDDMSTTQKAMFPTGMILSLPFLLLTVLVYVLLPQLQNLHGKTILSYVASMIFGYTFLAMIQANVSDLNTEHDTYCKTFGKLSFFSLFFLVFSHYYNITYP